MKLRKLATVLAAVMMVTASALPTYASSLPADQPQNTVEITVESANGEKEITVIDLNDMAKYEELADGTIVIPIQPRWSMSSHTISSGSKIWYTGSGSGMSLTRGQKVTIKASFDKSISYECGYSGGGYTSVMKTGTGSSISTSDNMPADGTYKFYITNKASSTVTVSSGSISY